MKTSLFWLILGSIAPELTQAWRAIRSRRRSTSAEQSNGSTKVTGRIAEHSGMVVQSGPLRGLQFPDALQSRAMGSKLLGTYEQEVHGFLQDAIAEAPDKVVVIGCAEGFYAAGLGRAIPHAQVQAFDIDPWARKMCLETARINGIADRIKIESFGRAEHLEALDEIRGLVVSDCEGFEYKLFDAGVIRHLSRSLILIETHAYLGFDNSEFINRFAETHSIKTVAFQGRSNDPKASLAPYLSTAELELAVNEFRPESQVWLYAKPLHGIPRIPAAPKQS